MARYAKNFLDSVVLRIDFEDVSLAKINEYKEAVQDTFDLNSTKSGYEGTINIDVSDGVMQQSSSELAIWEFQSTSKPHKQLSLSQRWMTIEYTEQSYTNSDELFDDVNKFIETFLDLFKVKIINRIGLRYINQVKPTDNSKPLDWSQYINQHLIGGLSFATETDEGLARSFSQQVYRRDEYELTFSYGIWNDDFPNPIVAKRFILDFDCSSSVPREKTDITLRSEIATYNALIEKHFEASITDKLREELGVQ